MKKLNWLLLIFFLSSASHLQANENVYELKQAKHQLRFEVEKSRGYLIVHKIILKNMQNGESTSFKVTNFKGVPEAGGIPVKIEDINEDGMEDFSLFLEAGPKFSSYLYFLYSPDKKGYVQLGVFPALKKSSAGVLASEEFGEDNEPEETLYHIKEDKLEPLNGE